MQPSWPGPDKYGLRVLFRTCIATAAHQSGSSVPEQPNLLILNWVGTQVDVSESFVCSYPIPPTAFIAPLIFVDLSPFCSCAKDLFPRLPSHPSSGSFIRLCSADQAERNPLVAGNGGLIAPQFLDLVLRRHAIQSRVHSLLFSIRPCLASFTARLRPPSHVESLSSTYKSESWLRCRSGA